MYHLIFVERNNLDSLVKAFFDLKDKAKQVSQSLGEVSKVIHTKRGKRPRNSIKGGGYVRPLVERKQANFEGIERPKG